MVKDNSSVIRKNDSTHGNGINYPTKKRGNSPPQPPGVSFASNFTLPIETTEKWLQNNNNSATDKIWKDKTPLPSANKNPT